LIQKKQNIGNTREISASIYNGQTVYIFVCDFPELFKEGASKKKGRSNYLERKKTEAAANETFDRPYSMQMA
jgi:hypothetical protein